MHILLGIEDSKKMAVTLQKQIDIYLKNDLHLEIKQNSIISRNENLTLFVGYKIKVVKKLNNIMLSKFANIGKYRNRLRAILKKSDARLAKSAVFALKKKLINTFRVNLFKKNDILLKNTLMKTFPILKNKFNLNENNSAVNRWEHHFEMLLDKELSLSLKFYYKQISNVLIHYKDFYHLDFSKLRNKFLVDLEKIQFKNRLSYLKAKKAHILKQKFKRLQEKILKNKSSTN